LAAKDEVLFETSELYSSAKDAKLVDLDKHKSIFHLFQDSKLFDLADKMVQWLNKSARHFIFLPTNSAETILPSHDDMRKAASFSSTRTTLASS
jgi:uncharacterized surface protein with fasciclin (FAS1) repeats